MIRLGRVKLRQIGLVRSGQNSSVRSGHSRQFRSGQLRLGKLVSSGLRSDQEVRLVDKDRLVQLGPVISVRLGQVGHSGQLAWLY